MNRLKPGRVLARPMLHPVGIELAYARRLRGFVRKLDADIRAGVARDGDALAREANQYRPDDDLPLSGWAALLNSLFQFLTRRLVDRLSAEGPAIVQRVSADVDTTNRRQWRAAVRAAYGVDVLREEPWRRPAISGWERENLNLITRMSQDRLTKVEGAISRALSQGTTQRDLARVVSEQLDVGLGRANVIARDQVAKLNSNLTSMRQQDIGVTEYVWQTSRDERVRPSHRAHQGRTYRWDSPPAGTGHPGHDVQCRCIAQAVLPDLAEIMAEGRAARAA